MCLAQGAEQGGENSWGRGRFPPAQIVSPCAGKCEVCEVKVKNMFSLEFLGMKWEKYRIGWRSKDWRGERQGGLPSSIAGRPSDYRKQAFVEGINTASVFLSKPAEVIIRKIERWLVERAFQKLKAML